MGLLASTVGGLLGRGVQALVPLLRRRSNAELMALLPSMPSPEARALLALPPLPGRDSAHFFLNFLRHADRRGVEGEALRALVRRHLVQPVVASEQARRATRARLGIDGLQSIIMTPTVACNLRCEHCYNLFEIHEQGGDRLTLATMQRVLGEARELGAYRASIIGGEPLLRWRDLVALARSYPDVLMTVFTNGLLLTAEMARELVAPGNLELAFSIDGLEQSHDRWRGEGNFKKTLGALGAFVEAGGMALVSPTVTAENHRELLGDEFLDLVEKSGAYMAYLHHYDLVGGQARADWLLSGEQLSWMKRRIEEIHQRRPLSVLSNVVSDLVPGGCPAARDFVHINHKGEVEPCCMVPFAADSVLERSLASILAGPFLTRVRNIPADASGVRRCLVGENLVELRRSPRGEALRGTTRVSSLMLAQHPPAAKLPTCFSTP